MCTFSPVSLTGRLRKLLQFQPMSLTRRSSGCSCSLTRNMVLMRHAAWVRKRIATKHREASSWIYNAFISSYWYWFGRVPLTGCKQKHHLISRSQHPKISKHQVRSKYSIKRPLDSVYFAGWSSQDRSSGKGFGFLKPLLRWSGHLLKQSVNCLASGGLLLHISLVEIALWSSLIYSIVVHA